MKHEYLIDLLKSNKTVILPNVGAFSNSDSPGHPFIFNEYLKFNDGMLVKYISSKDGITVDQAGADLEKFTAEFMQLINSGKEVVIPGVGSLKKTDGKLHLTTGMNKPVTEIKKPEPKVEPKVEKKPEPNVEPKEEKKPEPKIEPKVEKKPDPKAEPKTEIKKEEPLKKEEIKNDKKEVPAKDQKKLDKPVKKEKPVKEKSPKKRKRLVWLIIILLLLGGGGTAGYIFREDVMKLIGMDESVAENKEGDKDKEKADENSSDENADEMVADTTIVDDSTMVEENVVEEPVKEEPVVEEPVKEQPRVVEAGTSGNYYVIVGCFSMEPHASNMMDKVSAAGMTPINVGTFGSLIFVAAGSASDMDGALKECERVKGSFPKAWILKR